MNEKGELFSMKDAPFVEALVAADSTDAKAKEARQRLQGVLSELNPAGGKTLSAEDEKASKAKAEKKAKRKKQKKTDSK
jgi:hypothetical protein